MIFVKSMLKHKKERERNRNAEKQKTHKPYLLPKHGFVPLCHQHFRIRGLSETIRLKPVVRNKEREKKNFRKN